MILTSVLLLSIFFLIGLYNLCFNNINILRTLVFIELLFLIITLLFIMLSIFLNELTGSIFAIILFTTCAVDSAIGLSIVVAYCKLL
jgi:NADH:ubiquinone oxidoreductase subunit K